MRNWKTAVARPVPRKHTDASLSGRRFSAKLVLEGLLRNWKTAEARAAPGKLRDASLSGRRFSAKLVLDGLMRNWNKEIRHGICIV
mgnify:CR=1 FL=1